MRQRTSTPRARPRSTASPRTEVAEKAARNTPVTRPAGPLRFSLASLALEPPDRFGDDAQPRRPNRIGLPEPLRRGIEALSRHSLDDVHVHYRSPEPARLAAHAFARNREIHVAPGQERRLAHEAWHLTQQARGLVRPTHLMAGGVRVGNDPGHERDADLMGEKAMRRADAAGAAPAGVTPPSNPPAGAGVAQRDPNDLGKALLGLDPSTAGFGEKIRGHLSAGDVMRLRGVSRRAKEVADASPLEGTSVTLPELGTHFEGYSQTGLHGAASTDAASLYNGVGTGHADNFHGSLKLGPGFYMTDGSGPNETRAASHFAGVRVSSINQARLASASSDAESSSGGPAARSDPRSAVYRVFTRNLDALRVSSRDPKAPWLKPGAKELRPDDRGSGDAIRSEMPDMAKWGDPASAPKELKINPHIISDTLENGLSADHRKLLQNEDLRRTLDEKRSKFGLQVFPPTNDLGQDFMGVVARRIETEKKRRADQP